MVAGVDGAVAEEVDFLKYFGGREKVQERFGELIRTVLAIRPYSEVVNIEDKTKLNPELIRRINNGDYSVINSRTLEALANPFGVTYDVGFGEPNIPKEDIGKLMQMMKEAKFVCVGGADQFPQEDTFQMYLLLHALKKL
jgi:hypothetical protein